MTEQQKILIIRALLDSAMQDFREKDYDQAMEKAELAKDYSYEIEGKK